MLRFRFGRIPVEVHPSHFALAALLGCIQVAGLRTTGGALWPARLLAGDALGSAAGAAAAALLVFVGTVFAAVLVHELGHALVSLGFRYRPTIQLAWLGGFTALDASRPIPWHRQLALALAGPLASTSVGAVCVALSSSRLGAGSEVARYALGIAARINLAWAVLNLLPVLPLDGGRIVTGALLRAYGRAGMVAAQGLGLLLCAALIVWQRGNPLLVALFTLFGLHAARTLATAWRGEEASTRSDELVQAKGLFRAGELDRARDRAEAVAAGDASPTLRAHAHHLLGWIALKHAQGRRALDHFSQVQGLEVEEQALAAAFSLIGDDARAIPLWEKGWERTRDPTILHEWGGALIRAGKLDRASRLPGVDLAKAYRCAERVAFVRGDFTRAAELGLSALDRHPSAEVAYDVACALARAGEPDRAVLLLERARDLGFTDVAYARTDADLEALHGHPGFERWVLAVEKSTPA
jgi:Zn-dependent protease